MSKKMKELNKFYDSIFYCRHCSNCKITSNALINKEDPDRCALPICPAYEFGGFEAYSGAGRREIMFDLMEGLLDLDEATARVMYECSLCGACQEQCLSAKDDNWKTREAQLAFRIDAVRAGVGPLPEQKIVGEYIKKKHNPYDKPHEERLKWLPRDIELSKEPEVVYFVGCTTSYIAQKLAKQSLKILQNSGTNFSVMPDEWCCGIPLIETGMIDIAREQAVHNLETLKESGAQKVVSSCSGCYNALKILYPKTLGLDVDLEALHIVEFLDKLIESGELKFTNKLDEKVAFHDPCTLGRLVGLEKGLDGLYDQPRNVLKAIPGIELVEMPRNKENSWCCGAGGGVAWGFPDLRQFAADERLKEAMATGASAIVSACPGCRASFLLSRARGHLGKKIKVYDIVELVERAL